MTTETSPKKAPDAPPAEQPASKPEAAPQREPSTRPRALVTGASAGIGEEFARQLAKRGYDLVLAARRRDRMEALAKEVSHTRGANLEIIEADLSTPAGVALVEERLAKGDIEMLVNNAGFATNGRFADLPLDRQLGMIDVNIRALTQLSHAALKQMKAKKRGTIINVGSTGSYVPVPFMATYAATKAYVLSFSEALHEEAKANGVTVTCLCPGGTTTEFQEVAGLRTEKMPKRAFVGPEPVVKAALDAAKAGSAIAVPGLMNKATANLPRIFPRFATRKLAGSIFRNE